MRNVQDMEFPGLSAEEADTIRGVIYAMDVIRSQTAHGSININIVDGVTAEIDIQQRIRPKYSVPWRPKPV